MDIASIIGLLLGFGSIVVAAAVSHANMSLLYQKYEALVLVLGGTMGAAFLSFPLQTALFSLRQGFDIMLFEHKPQLQAMIDRFAGYSDIARRKGILLLEGELETIADPSVRRSLEMIIDGQDAVMIRTVLETETDVEVGQMRDTESFFGALGGFSPTLGIIGTVLGLIAMLGKLGALSESGNIAGSIGGETAAAFIATFLGVTFANLLWLPIAGKVKARVAILELEREMLTEAILMLQAGNSPTVLRQKLGAYITRTEPRVSRPEPPPLPTPGVDPIPDQSSGVALAKAAMAAAAAAAAATDAANAASVKSG